MLHPTVAALADVDVKVCTHARMATIRPTILLDGKSHAQQFNSLATTLAGKGFAKLAGGCVAGTAQ